MQYKGYKDLKVYNLAYKLAMEIFEETKHFPKEERFSLTDQIIRKICRKQSQRQAGMRIFCLPSAFCLLSTPYCLFFFTLVDGRGK